MLKFFKHFNANSTNAAWVGAGWKISAFACYAALNGIARYLSGGALSQGSSLPVAVIVFFQDFVALAILLPWILKQCKKAEFLSCWRLHLSRVLASAGAIMTWYLALAHMPLGEAVALSIVGPLFGVLGAKVLLREKINVFRFYALSVTFLVAFFLAFCYLRSYTLFMQNPGNLWGLLFVLLSSILFALAKINTRQLALKGETPQALTAYLLLLMVPVSFIPAVVTWQTPLVAHVPWLFLAGILTAMAIYAVSAALSYAEVTFLAPFDCIRFIFNIAVGYLAFTEIPASWAFGLVFILMMLSGGSFLHWKQRSVKRL